MEKQIWIAVLLALATFAVYGQVRDHAFTSYGDRRLVVENPLVVEGLAADAIGQAFTRPQLRVGSPVAIVSLQLDRSLHGGDPGLTLLHNVALHALATVMLFLAVLRLSGALGASAFVAAVFGLHPLHVESVAWASARSDVLAGVFAALCLWLHAGHARAPRVASLAAVCAAGTGAMLSLATLVVLPVVLLLLDLWPLERLKGDGDRPRRLLRLVLEKAPLLVVAGAVSAVTLAGRTGDPAGFPPELLPLGLRLQNACLSTALYLRDALWPVGLAAIHPHPLAAISTPLALASAAGLAAVTAGCAMQARRRPYLLVGWLWLLVTLAPSIGLVQVGLQARSDRFTYIPLVGLALMLAFAGSEWAKGIPRRRRRRIATTAGVAAVALLSLLSWRQVRVWRSSEALYRHALAVTEGSYVAHAGLGRVLLDLGRPDEATEQFQAAAALYDDPRWQLGLADAHAAAGRQQRAVETYQGALEAAPELTLAHGNLGILLVALGRHEEARGHLERALALGQDTRGIHRALGESLAVAGRHAAARLEFEAALAGVDDAGLRLQAGRQAELAGEPERAIEHYREALRRAPDRGQVASRLAWLLATCQEPGVRDPQAALAVLDAASKDLDNPSARILHAWAVAHAAAGDGDAALRMATRAAAVAEAEGNRALADEILSQRASLASGEGLRRSCRGQR